MSESAPSKSNLGALLLARYGLVMGTAQLREALCYPSTDALRVAIARGKVGLRTFTIPGRRGHFALTQEVATHLDEHMKASFPDKQTEVPHE
jgi:hypothetical protein